MSRSLLNDQQRLARLHPLALPETRAFDESVEGAQRSLPDIGTEDRERAAIGELFNRLAEATKVTLARMSIGQFVRDFYAPRAPTRIEDRFTGR